MQGCYSTQSKAGFYFRRGCAYFEEPKKLHGYEHCADGAAADYAGFQRLGGPAESGAPRLAEEGLGFRDGIGESPGLKKGRHSFHKEKQWKIKGNMKWKLTSLGLCGLG